MASSWSLSLSCFSWWMSLGSKKFSSIISSLIVLKSLKSSSFFSSYSLYYSAFTYFTSSLTGIFFYSSIGSKMPIGFKSFESALLSSFCLNVKPYPSISSVCGWYPIKPCITSLLSASLLLFCAYVMLLWFTIVETSSVIFLLALTGVGFVDSTSSMSFLY